MPTGDDAQTAAEEAAEAAEVVGAEAEVAIENAEELAKAADAAEPDSEPEREPNAARRGTFGEASRTLAREVVKNIFKKRRQLQVASEGRNQGHLWLPLLSGGEKISQEATLPTPLRKTLEVR